MINRKKSRKTRRKGREGLNLVAFGTLVQEHELASLYERMRAV